ncbi:MAG: hypothetical protein N0A16_13505 [Blastocatellia bacterium]|nr:hypothetical protein [Blastocatellia bacterium]
MGSGLSMPGDGVKDDRHSQGGDPGKGTIEGKDRKVMNEDLKLMKMGGICGILAVLLYGLSQLFIGEFCLRRVSPDGRLFSSILPLRWEGTFFQPL